MSEQPNDPRVKPGDYEANRRGCFCKPEQVLKRPNIEVDTGLIVCRECPLQTLYHHTDTFKNRVKEK